MQSMLVDANIFIDVITQREGWEASRQLIRLAQEGEVQGWISADTFVVFYHFRRRVVDEQQARRDTQGITAGFRIIPLRSDMLSAGLASALPDFEDNLLIESALDFGLDVIVEAI